MGSAQRQTQVIHIPNAMKHIADIERRAAGVALASSSGQTWLPVKARILGITAKVQHFLTVV